MERLGLGPTAAQGPTVHVWREVAGRDGEPTFELVAFDDPLWVLFSSGTTGRPKGIVPALPHTRTVERLEVPIKRMLLGADPDTVVQRSAPDDPGLLAPFVEIARPAPHRQGADPAPGSRRRGGAGPGRTAGRR